MRKRDHPWSGSARRGGLLWPAAIIFAQMCLGSALAQSSGGEGSPAPNPSENAQPPSAKALEEWQAAMRRVPPPKKGCFTSVYPAMEWREVACGPAPKGPYSPKRQALPAIVGNGNDVSAQGTGLITQAVGSFDSVVGVTSETGAQGANAFSLQINTNTFRTSACNGAKDPTNCWGWQQFIYSNSGGDANGVTSNFAAGFMEYWLLGYGSNCPSGWNSYQDSCSTNSGGAVPIVKQDVTNLAALSLAGFAEPSGDSVTVGVGGTLSAAFGDDTVLNLAQGWTQAEFNIVGDGNGSQANFNAGATIVVRTAIDTASSGAPACVDIGQTGETNNLSFAAPPANPPGGFLPAVVFTESTGGGAASPCQSAAEVGALTPPTPSAPTGTINTLTPTFAWSGGANFSGLGVNILTHSAPARVVYESPALPANATSMALPPGVLDWGGNYMWQVEACGEPAGPAGPGACLDNPSWIFFSTQQLFQVAVAAAPTAAAGAVSGGGAFPAGSAPTVTATAAGGFVFANWTQNFKIVSSSASYQLPPLTANESLTANFLGATQTTLVSAPNPSSSGRPVTFVARVNAAGLSGGMIFRDGPTTLGIVAMTRKTGFVARLTTTNLGVGKHTITATFTGNPLFAGSQSAALIQIVRGAHFARHRKSIAWEHGDSIPNSLTPQPKASAPRTAAIGN